MPAPALAPGLQAALVEAALAGARALRYENLGTMEFLVAADGAFHFLEMNPRLQVERAETIARLGAALDEFRVDGPPTTLALHRRIVREPGFVAGGVTSAYLERLPTEEGA